MNPRTLRRLATDHAALHNQALPPNYLWPSAATSTTTDDDLTQLDIFLAGPTHTPFTTGLFSLHLTIPQDYPTHPPAAFFRTPIFHPNVDAFTGGVCVETLKRDWTPETTLRDVLVVISCLLIQPNEDSALNAEAGALIQEDFDAFGRRAKLMCGIHAKIPKEMEDLVREAQERGSGGAREEADAGAPPVRKRRMMTARQRGAAASRRSAGSPTDMRATARARTQAGPSQPFIMQTRGDDVFGSSSQQDSARMEDTSSSEITPDDQENDASKSPTKATTPRLSPAMTPKRPQGRAVPLGELEILSDDDDNENGMEMETEYPPSPRKSPSKTSPTKARRVQAESSTRTPQNPYITPPTNLFTQPLALDSPYSSYDTTTFPDQVPASPRKTPAPSKKIGGISKTKSPGLDRKEREEERKRKLELAAKDAELWELCGRDVRRWNRGDFGSGNGNGGLWKVRGGRW